MYVKAKVTSKYQITLPKGIREKLGIQKGDEVIFEGKDDEMLMKVERKVDPVEAIEGILEGADLGELRSGAASKMLAKKLGL
ncbi:MAG: AbrB/MazE/SpoVT family DNA-binding domain-containing protein [Candidatus Hydrothermarchaeaceae archaeon]